MSGAADKCVLLLASTRAYHTGDFERAARRLGVALAVGSDRCHVLAESWPEGAWSLDFRDPERAAAQIARRAAEVPLAGIVATDERTAVIAARAGARLGLATNPPEAAAIAGDKLALREALAAAGLPQPAFARVAAGDPLPAGLDYPVVLKPLHLSASRGVMRADDAADLAVKAARLAALLADPELRATSPAATSEAILVESFVPGPEVAYEGLLRGGRLETLAIFDKPDPLDGPFFPETIYVTPSALSPATRDAIAATVARAADAIGLVEGPVHAELRLPPPRAGGGPGWGDSPRPATPVVLEVAARSIGGLCGRALRFGAGLALEEIIVAHAAGLPLASQGRERAASGVYMLPVPAAGVVTAIEGVEDAGAVLGDAGDVAITARIGDTVAPLPEGDTYMGFVFARSDTPDVVVRLLRAAAAAISVRVAPRL